MNWTNSKTSRKESNIKNIQYVSVLIMLVNSTVVDIALLHKEQWVQKWPTEDRAVNLIQLYTLFLH